MEERKIDIKSALKIIKYAKQRGATITRGQGDYTHTLIILTWEQDQDNLGLDITRYPDGCHIYFGRNHESLQIESLDHFYLMLE